MCMCVHVCVFVGVFVCALHARSTHKCTCMFTCVLKHVGLSQGTVRAIAFSATAQTLAIASSIQTSSAMHPQSYVSLFRVQAQDSSPFTERVLVFEPFEQDGIQHVFFVGGSDSVILTVNSNRTQYVPGRLVFVDLYCMCVCCSFPFYLWRTLWIRA